MGATYLGRGLAIALVLQGVASSCGDDGDPAAPPGDGGARPVPDASGPGPGPEGGPEAGVSLDAFEAWEQIHAALAESPDQRLARADELVASRSAERIFRFVRDEIATYPPADAGFDGAVTAQRWGVRGTLRGGAGTPREKVELLLSLYGRAGLEAEAVVGTADPAFLDGQKVLLHDLSPKFSLPGLVDRGAAWKTGLGNDALPSRPLIDVDGSARKALTATLLGLLPESLSAPFDFTLGQIPLVRVRDGSASVYANPIASNVAYRASLTLEKDLAPAPPADAPPAITLRLEGARANAPFERFTLVEGRYEAADVVGRKVHLGFVPPVKTAELLTTRVDSVTNFVPLLSVAGPDTTLEERNRLARVGNPVSASGDLYTFSEDGAVTINGAPMPPAKLDPEAAQGVDAVDASVDAATFPDIIVRVQATDVGGDGVGQLPAGAIGLTEEGAAVSFAMVQNEAPPPKIALLFDTSTSIPDTFRGVSAANLGKSLAAQLFGRYPNAQIRAGTVWFGANWFDGTWATSVAEADTQIDGVVSAPGGSEIWSALADAAAVKPTLTIIVTDGVPSEPVTGENRVDVAAGPPVLALGVGDVEQPTLDAIAETSGGTTFSVSDSTAVVNAAIAAIDRQKREEYVLRYRAPEIGPGSRTVEVTLNGKTVQVEYTVPADPAGPSALSGLYLTVQVGERSSTRALAGLAQASATGRPEITEPMLADVRAMLRGRVSFSIEGAAPSPSIVLSEWISEKLALKPLFEALAARNAVFTLGALEAGLVSTPGPLPMSQAALPRAWTKDALTFETGPRVTSLVQKIHVGGPVTRGLDVWPLTRWATAAADPRTAFERTLESTSALAIFESELLKARSTVKTLDGARLTAVPAGQARDQAGLSDQERLRWAFLEEPFSSGYTLLVPQKPGPFWAVDGATGTVIGVLEDGSGGAGDDACSGFRDANSMITALGMIGSLAGASVGGWAMLAKWEVKYVTIATIVIGGGSLPPGSADINNPAGDIACGIADDAITGAFPAVGAYEAIHDAYEASGADTGAPTVCGAFDSQLCK